MTNRLCSLLVVVASASVMVACQNQPSRSVGPSPVDSAAPAAAAGPTQLAAKPEAVSHVVTLFDACDPETFNAVLGDGACVRSGGVRFPIFLEQLGKHGSVGAWHFAPNEVSMRVGDMLVAMNRGGEAHTFTEVEEFGGGIVPVLNDILGLKTVAPECQAVADTGVGFIPPGGSTSEKEEDAGVEKYQCCIHPWMKAEVRVREK